MALGVLFSPLLGLIVGLVVLHLRHPEGFSWLDSRISRPSASLIYLGTFVLWAYAGMVLLGIPTYICFQRQNWKSAWHYGLAGFSGGILTVILVMNLIFLRPITTSDLQFRLFPYGILQPGVVGITTGLAFWIITVWKRHNKACDVAAHDGRRWHP